MPTNTPAQSAVQTAVQTAIAADRDAFPRKRRPVLVGVPAAVTTAGRLWFSADAARPGSDFDVLMGYQIFLGRDPENSFVIADAKSSAVSGFIRACLNSGEFRDVVMVPLREGRRLRHGVAGAAPSAAQRAWLLRMVSFDAAHQARLGSLANWEELFALLAPLDGFPPLHLGDTAAAAGTVVAEIAASSPDFVMITVESPGPDAALQPGGQISGVGWVIAPSDITAIVVELDGVEVAQARYGLSRPDVARHFPHYRQVDLCGFSFAATLPGDFDPAIGHDLLITARTETGAMGEKAVRLAQMRAPVVDSYPIRIEINEASVDAGGQLRLRGFAVARVGIAYISASLGDMPLPRLDTGLARADAAAIHPDYGNAGHSGFALSHGLDGFDFAPASVRVVAVDVGGIERQAMVPLTLPERREPAAEGQADGFKFCCDVAKLDTSGALVVAGWALAAAGLRTVEVVLDGAVVGLAEIGRARPDVALHHAGMIGAEHAGFRLELDVGGREAGEHELTLRLIGADGAERKVAMTVTAEAAQTMMTTAAGGLRLEIDRPMLPRDGAPVVLHGALTIQGWVVSRAGVAGVEVFCGDERLGDAYLGMRREDIAAAFPDYPGSLLAGYALVLPPGGVTPGAHNIRVVAHGRDGETITSRFTLQADADDVLPPGVALHTRVSRPEAALSAALLARMGQAPGFRVLVTATDAQAATLADLAVTLRSLVGQSYAAWSATIVFARAADAAVAAKDAGLSALVDALAKGQVVISASDLAAAVAGNRQWVMRLRAGDRLGCDALAEFAQAGGADRAALLMYADDQRAQLGLATAGAMVKPAFSAELLLGMNYIGRAWCADETLLAAAGVSLGGLADMADWDAVLRLTEAAGGKIGNIARVLLAEGGKGDSTDAGLAALRAAFARRRMAASVTAGDVPGIVRTARKVARAHISVIMPSCGARDLVRLAINTIRATAKGHDVEIVVLDNIPDPKSKTKGWLKRHADVVVAMPAGFNWSAFNNAGARAASGDVLLFLNDDIEANTPGWLDALLEHAMRPEVGVVGARLLYPDGKIQHAGQYLAGNHARHAFRFAHGDDPGPFGLARVAREMVSVTGACMMMRRAVFAALGGFDEAHSVVNNDLDFCLRVARAGLRVIYTPHATLVHHELASRARIDDRYDSARFDGDWHQVFLAGDPWRSPSLLAESDHYAVDSEAMVSLLAGNPGPDIASVRKILAVKLDHIGDYLTALPALRRIKTLFPGAELHLLAPGATAALARHEPGIDGVIEFTFFHARSAEGKREVTPAEYDALAARLAPYAFDLAIDLRMQPETRAVLRHTGARLLAGFDHQGAFPWLDVALEWEGDTALQPKRAHVSERLVQLVAVVAADAQADVPPAPPPALKPADVTALARLGPGFLARPLVCVHPGVGNPVRQWPQGHYAGLIDLLVAEYGVNVVLVGAGEEIAIADEVLGQVRARASVVSLAGKINLTELGQVMRACVLFIGNNSGPKHLAASLGVPTIGIHSSVVDPAEWAPVGAVAIALKRQMACGPCYLEFASDCPRGLVCLSGMRPSDVAARARVFLASAGVMAQPLLGGAAVAAAGLKGGTKSPGPRQKPAPTAAKGAKPARLASR